jgi:hypothetical protein
MASKPQKMPRTSRPTRADRHAARKKDGNRRHAAHRGRCDEQNRKNPVVRQVCSTSQGPSRAQSLKLGGVATPEGTCDERTATSTDRQNP